MRQCLLFVKTAFLLAGMGGVSLLFILAHDALTQSSCFEARSITVEGNRRLSREAILRQAEVKPGDNILGVNLRVLRHRLTANPWIAAAEVRRELPDVIHIRITERVPIAKVELGRTFYLDDTGEIVNLAGPSDSISVPVVTGLRRLDVDPKNPVRSRVFEAVVEVLHLSRLYGSHLPLAMVSRIEADPDMGLTLFGFEGKTAIHLGFGDYRQKYDRLGDILSHFRQGDRLNIAHIYLKDVERVVVRPSEGVSALGAYCRKGV